jgi:hypothetical protein
VGQKQVEDGLDPVGFYGLAHQSLEGLLARHLMLVAVDGAL